MREPSEDRAGSAGVRLDIPTSVVPSRPARVAAGSDLWHARVAGAERGRVGTALASVAEL